MGFVADLFDSSRGAGFNGQSTPILNPTTTQQAQTAYNQTQGGIQAQGDLMALLGQHNGVQTQQDLINQLIQQSQGGGPNPALAQLNLATGQNTANQAALMAGQRGSSANVGLLARQAAQQGAANQQNAIGQGAVLQAQQQLAAQNALGSLANQQVGQYQNAVTGVNQATQGSQQNLLNSIAQQNNSNIGMQSNINNVNGQIAQGNQRFQQGVVGNLAGNIGSILHLSGGGQVDNGSSNKSHYEAGGPVSTFGKMLSNSLANQSPNIGAPVSNVDQAEQSGQKVGGLFSNLLSQKLSRSPVGSEVGQAGTSDLVAGRMPPVGQLTTYSGGSIDYTSGGKLPGKASVEGDSLKNDKVPILGSPGEIMLPRSVTMAKDAPQKAAEFVAAILAKQKRKK